MNTHPHELAHLLRHGHVLLVRPMEPQPVFDGLGCWYPSRATGLHYASPGHFAKGVAIDQPHLAPHPPGSEVALECMTFGPDEWDGDSAPATVTSVEARRVAELEYEDWERTGLLTEANAARWVTASMRHWTAAYPDIPYADAWAWAMRVERRGQG